MRSNIVFGSMRMLEKNSTLKYWVDMFEFMYEQGIREHHVSYEYESYDFYLNVLKDFQFNNPTKKLSYICKLAEPSFDDLNFSQNRLKSKCAKYSADLNSNDLSIQWMSRYKLNDLENRISHLIDFCGNLNKEILKLKKTKFINEFLVFPYSPAELELYLEHRLLPHANGYIVYCNLNETEYSERLVDFKSKNNAAIRPFQGKKSLENYSVEDNLKFIADLNSFNRVITSFSTKDQINEVLRKIH